MIIALGGLPRSGKDTAAQYLIEKHGFRKVAFADGVRKALETFNPMLLIDHGGEADAEITYYKDAVEEYGYEYTKENSPQVRGYLQRMGTDVGRKMFGEEVWVEQARRAIYSLLKEDVPVVVTDTRFVNELSMLQRVGASTVWLARKSAEFTEHESDNALDKYDFDNVINNNGTVSKLYEDIEYVLSKLKECDD